MGRARGPRNEERAEHMRTMHAAGATLEQIGTHYGLTRERVRQILKSIGVSRRDGGIAARTRRAADAKSRMAKSLRDARTFKVYGCDYATAVRLNNGSKRLRSGGGPAERYYAQRHSAAWRGIEWALSFPEWMEIWEQSGHFHERGRGSGYVMARIGDCGPYAVGNVEVISGRQNGRDYQLITRPMRGQRPGFHRHAEAA
jgi:hypothetical protein